MRARSPEIYPHGNENIMMNFQNAGSGGIKTIINICFALSIHHLASEYNLPMPSFLIIDTPTKNIDREIQTLIYHECVERINEYLKD